MMVLSWRNLCQIFVLRIIVQHYSFVVTAVNKKNRPEFGAVLHYIIYYFAMALRISSFMRTSMAVAAIALMAVRFALYASSPFT